MEHRKLIKVDLDLPVIGLGTWSTFDTDENCGALTEEAIAAGVRLFDSSPMYGKAEASLALALGDMRQQALIATKVAAEDPQEGRCQVLRSLDLFTTIDIYQVHNLIGWRVQLPMLEALKADGRITAIGITQGLSVSDDDFLTAMRTGKIDCIQVKYNPKRKHAMDRILPVAADLGIGVLVMQPMRWGVLLAQPTANELEQLGVRSWPEAILRWIISDRRVTSVLTATATKGRIGSNAAAGDGELLDEDQRALVERIVSRPLSAEPNSSPHVPAAMEVLKEKAVEVLMDQKGAAYCDSCLGRSLATSTEIGAHVREWLPDTFIRENSPCLICGGPGPVVRARTLIR